MSISERIGTVMNKKLIKLISAGALLLCGCGSNTNSEEPKTAETYSNVSVDSGFDTVIYYRETTDDKNAFDSHFEEVTTMFTYYNKLFDIYNTYDGITNLKTINDNAGVQAVSVDAAIIDLLKEAKEFYDMSNGEFNVTMGSILKVWHNYREDGISKNENGEYGELPKDEKLAEAAQHVGWDAIQIDDKNNTVFITDPDVSLDVGGIAKGYATELIARKLEKEGVVHAAINAGGNTRTLGEKADGSDWKIRIQNPVSSDDLLVVTQPGKISFVTSGDYERYYVATDGQRYSHIIDPETNYPARRYHSVTIITQDSGAADCLSTTLFTMSVTDGMKVLEAYKKANNTDINAVWMSENADEMPAENTKSVELTDSDGNKITLYIAWTEGLSDSLIWG